VTGVPAPGEHSGIHDPLAALVLAAARDLDGDRRCAQGVAVVRSPGVLQNPHRDMVAARAFGSRLNVPILFLRIEPIFAGLVFSKRHFAEKDKNDA
jgi:hypothetical protein